MSADQNTDAYDLFLCAVREMESASSYRRKKQYLALKDAVQSSACCLARALLLAQGKSTSKNVKVDVLLTSDELNQLRNNNNPVYRAILDVISLDYKSNLNVSPDSKTQDIYNRFRDALISGRKMLAQDLNYNDHLWKKIKCLLFTGKGFKKSAYFFLPLLVFITLPVAVYHYLEPVHNANLLGEIFWKSNTDTAFSHQLSQHFTVTGGNNFREYTIELGQPADIYILRFDPLHRKDLAIIEVEWIRMINEHGMRLKELTAEDMKQWACINCVKLNKGDNSMFKIQVIDNDPQLISTVMDSVMVKSVNIRMRILSRKTFWEWILGIDN